MTRKIIITLTTIMQFYSCGLISINGTSQGLMSYYSKTQPIEPELFIKTNDSAEIRHLINRYSNKVIVTNGKELKRCISNHEKAMVYLWAPKCKSAFCPDLNLLQQNCDKRNIELFIVAEYYDYKLMKKQYSIERNIIGIDTKYYSSNFTSKYMKKFLNDLKTKKDTISIRSRIVLFNNGTLTKSILSIAELDSTKPEEIKN